ncbi:MAG: hypothetical protein AABX19_03590 [Nanoarchaeota archaeon]
MEDHPRVIKMKEFYNREPKVCSFMNPDITRFVLVPNVYSDDVIGPSVLDWAKTRKPLALSYVWEKDPGDLERERAIGIEMFGNLLRILVEDETGNKINCDDLEKELSTVFSPDSQIHPFLGYRGDPFFSIIMSPNHSSRYAPCFSMVLTRQSDVLNVRNETRDKIRYNSERMMGRSYDAKALFVYPGRIRFHK